VKDRLISGADQSAALDYTSASGGELNIANAMAGAQGTRYSAESSASTRTVSSSSRSYFSQTRIAPVWG